MVWSVTLRWWHHFLLSHQEWVDYADVQAECGNTLGNKPTRNLSGNAWLQSSQLAEPLWTDPGIKSGISLRHHHHHRDPHWLHPTTGQLQSIGVLGMSPTDCDQEEEQDPYRYTIHIQTLEWVASAKYLGVELTETLHWGKHMQSTTVKTNKVSAFPYRNLKRCPTAVQTNCYKDLIHPVLEYASVVWDPCQQIWSPQCNNGQPAASFMTSVPPQGFCPCSSAPARMPAVLNNVRQSLHDVQSHEWSSWCRPRWKTAGAQKPSYWGRHKYQFQVPHSELIRTCILTPHWPPDSRTLSQQVLHQYWHYLPSYPHWRVGRTCLITIRGSDSLKPIFNSSNCLAKLNQLFISLGK